MKDFTFQLNEITGNNGRIRRIFRKIKFALRTTHKINIKPSSEEVHKGALNKSLESESVGIVEPNTGFEKRTGLCITSSLSRLHSSTTSLDILNCTPNHITIPKNTIVARFKILTPKQAKYLYQIAPALIASDPSKSINELVTTEPTTDHIRCDDFWFPTPENCHDPSKLTPRHVKSMTAYVHSRRRKK